MPGASPVSLAQAADVPGAPLTLPSGKGVGEVSSWRTAHSLSVAVTYPSRGVAVRYTTPVPYGDALANYEGYAHATPGARVIRLDGVPALTEGGRRPRTWSSVEFVSHRRMIVVMGTADRSTLEHAAESIVMRARASRP